VFCPAAPLGASERISSEFTCTIGHVFSSESAWGERLLGGRFGEKIQREVLPGRLGAPVAVIALYFAGDNDWRSFGRKRISRCGLRTTMCDLRNGWQLP
jgi:hypothetical protein